jgi:hypothetical protein
VGSAGTVAPDGGGTEQASRRHRPLCHASHREGARPQGLGTFTGKQCDHRGLPGSGMANMVLTEAGLDGKSQFKTIMKYLKEKG